MCFAAAANHVPASSIAGPNKLSSCTTSPSASYLPCSANVFSSFDWHACRRVVRFVYYLLQLLLGIGSAGTPSPAAGRCPQCEPLPAMLQPLGICSQHSFWPVHVFQGVSHSFLQLPADEAWGFCLAGNVLMQWQCRSVVAGDFNVSAALQLPAEIVGKAWADAGRPSDAGRQRLAMRALTAAAR